MKIRLTNFAWIAAAALLAGCTGETEEPKLSRVPGLEGNATAASGSAPSTGRDPHAGMGEIQTARLNPGMPGGDGSTTGAPPMAGGGGMIPAAPDTKVLVGGNKLQAAGIAFTVPDGWESVKPASRMRVAQYNIPGEGGRAEMAVFYFGPGQGGGVEDNVKRWAGQFSSDDPTTSGVPIEAARLQLGDLEVALVRASGTYDPGSMGPMAPANTAPKKGYALFGVVVNGGPEGPLFVKVTGPKATMDAQAANLEAFARSAKKSDFK